MLKKPITFFTNIDQHFRPIPSLIALFTYGLSGKSILVYQLIAFTIHIFNGYFFYSITKKVKSSLHISLLLTTLYLIHPINLNIIFDITNLTLLLTSTFILSLVYVIITKRIKTMSLLLFLFIGILINEYLIYLVLILPILSKSKFKNNTVLLISNKKSYALIFFSFCSYIYFATKNNFIQINDSFLNIFQAGLIEYGQNISNSIQILLLSNVYITHHYLNFFVIALLVIGLLYAYKKNSISLLILSIISIVNIPSIFNYTDAFNLNLIHSTLTLLTIILGSSLALKQSSQSSKTKNTILILCIVCITINIYKTTSFQKPLNLANHQIQLNHYHNNNYYKGIIYHEIFKVTKDKTHFKLAEESYYKVLKDKDMSKGFLLNISNLYFSVQQYQYGMIFLDRLEKIEKYNPYRFYWMIYLFNKFKKTQQELVEKQKYIITVKKIGIKIDIKQYKTYHILKDKISIIQQQTPKTLKY